MTEQQRYHILERRGPVELRRYEACTVADVVIEGSAEQAGNAAFQPLLGYISGRNDSHLKLRMTAPVIQERVSEQVAIGGPAMRRGVDADRWTVSFVLPDHDSPQYPDPGDPRVTLRAVPEHTAAALRWSGRWTRANVERHTQALAEAVAAAGWQPAGTWRWARYDPPWLPPFARRNEIVLPVSVSGRQ